MGSERHAPGGSDELEDRLVAQAGVKLAAGPGGQADLRWLAEFRRPRG